MAGREHAARAAHDDHADSLVGLRQVERLVDLGQQFVALGVQHLWPVEGDDPEGTFDAERDLPEVADLRRPAIAHARCLLPCRRSPLGSIWLLATVCLDRCSWGGLLNDARQRTATAQRYVRSGEYSPLPGQRAGQPDSGAIHPGMRGGQSDAELGDLSGLGRFG